MKRLVNVIAGWILGLLVLLLRRTLRYRVLSDSRAALRDERRPYVIVLLHAHQIAAVCFNDEARLCAMVSRSADGDLLVPALRLRGVTPVRGSSRKRDKDKGGTRALLEMAHLVESGVPGLITVDGPRGPRGEPQPGAAVLSQRIDAVVVPAMLVPRWRWVLSGTWDRMQVPLPGSRVDIVFAEPIRGAAWVDRDALRAEIGRALRELEQRMDAGEARFSHPRAGAVSSAS